VVVEEASAGPIERAIEKQLETAAALASARNATAVIWFNHDGPPKAGVSVYVSVPGRDRLLVRRVEASRARSNPTSAVFEAAALIVQSSLRAIEDGKPVGVPPATETVTPPPPAEPPPAAMPAPAPARPPTRAAEPEPVQVVVVQPPPETSWGFYASAGPQWMVDGQTPSGEIGGAVSVGAAQGDFALAVCLSSTVPAELSDARSTVLLSRHTGAACGSFTPLRWHGFSLALTGQLGYAAFYRQTSVTAADVSATSPGLSSSLLVGAGATERWQMSSSWALSLGLGVDWIPGSPTLGYDVAGQIDGARSLWTVQPRATLALELSR